ncbi:MAG: TauD/TfdA family dioxygenase [Pseudomonadota bacterium]
MTGALGADLYNCDPTTDVAFIQHALAQFGVVTLRGVDLSPGEHIALATAFGAIDINRFFTPHPDHPEIALVIKEPHQQSAIGEGWHTDHSYDLEPALGSLLLAKEVPEVGGDTVFVSMAAAWEALPSTLQTQLLTCYAWHETEHVFGASALNDTDQNRFQNADAATQKSRHPVAIKHPLSGRTCLYVNPVFTTGIDGLPEAESTALLEHLYAHCADPTYHCRVRWQAGDLTIWDNRATWHKAINDYDGQRREMHRITVAGCALESAA